MGWVPFSKSRSVESVKAATGRSSRPVSCACGLRCAETRGFCPFSLGHWLTFSLGGKSPGSGGSVAAFGTPVSAGRAGGQAARVECERV